MVIEKDVRAGDMMRHIFTGNIFKVVRVYEENGEPVWVLGPTEKGKDPLEVRELKQWWRKVRRP